MDPASITVTPKIPKPKKMTLEEFRELFERMCTECSSDMRRILIKNGILN